MPARIATVILDDRLLIEDILVGLKERAERHMEAAAMGRALNATILLSVEAARGVLPTILDAEDIRWRIIEIG